MAGNGINGFDFTVEARCLPGIKQSVASIKDLAGGNGPCQCWSRLNIAGWKSRHFGCRGLAGGELGIKAAVQHSDVFMAEPAQQPPEAGSKRAGILVVADDG